MRNKDTLAQLVTKTGYEITIEPSKKHPGWFSASGFNRNLNTSTWGLGVTKEAAVRDCLVSIYSGKIFKEGVSMTGSKDSLLTYHDGSLSPIADLYGDRLQRLCLGEKFSILKDIAAWGEQCAGTEETDWSSLGEFTGQWGETPDDSDAYKVLIHESCNYTHFVHAMALVTAIAHQIAEEIYLPEDGE